MAAPNRPIRVLPLLLKLFHEIGAVGTLGSFAACIVLLSTTPTGSAVGYAAVLEGVSALTQWLLVPSLAVVLVSGLLAIAANDAYKDAAWAWVKALLGIGIFEGTLLTVGAGARNAARLSALASQGGGSPLELAQALRAEWGGLVILAALAVINIVIAVWRPRLYPKGTL